MAGRPSTYTKEVADEICARLSEGEPLVWICRDDHMPSRRTVGNWRAANEDFNEKFLTARDDGFDVIAAGTMEISDTVEPDAAHVSKAKLRIETRLKLLAKWDPRRYGDKVALTGGTEDDAPIKSELTVKFV